MEQRGVKDVNLVFEAERKTFSVVHFFLYSLDTVPGRATVNLNPVHPLVYLLTSTKGSRHQRIRWIRVGRERE